MSSFGPTAFSFFTFTNFNRFSRFDTISFTRKVLSAVVTFGIPEMFKIITNCSVESPNSFYAKSTNYFLVNERYFVDFDSTLDC